MNKRQKVALAGAGVALGLTPWLFGGHTPPAPAGPVPSKVQIDGPLFKVRGHDCPDTLTHVQCKAAFPKGGK